MQKSLHSTDQTSTETRSGAPLVTKAIKHSHTTTQHHKSGHCILLEDPICSPKISTHGLDHQSCNIKMCKPMMTSSWAGHVSFSFMPQRRARRLYPRKSLYVACLSLALKRELFVPLPPVYSSGQFQGLHSHWTISSSPSLIVCSRSYPMGSTYSHLFYKNSHIANENLIFVYYYLPPLFPHFSWIHNHFDFGVIRISVFRVWQSIMKLPSVVTLWGLFWFLKSHF